MAITVALTLSYAAAAWGAALYTFLWIAQLSNPPPIADTVQSSGLISLIAGASTVAALIIVAFGMVAVVDRLSGPEKPLPSPIRGLYQIARFTTANSRQPCPASSSNCLTTPDPKHHTLINVAHRLGQAWRRQSTSTRGTPRCSSPAPRRR